ANVRAAADDEWPHVLQLVVAVAQIDVDVAADGGRERRPETDIDKVARRRRRAVDGEVPADGAPEQVAREADDLCGTRGGDGHVLANGGRLRQLQRIDPVGRYA